MARARSAESPRTRSKAAAIEEIAQGLATFQGILTSIEDFSREGFPYRDGARAKAELQIRETARRLFGERSPEYQAHRAHKLKISTSAETTQSVQLVKSFIAALERKKLELQGLPLTETAPEAEGLPTVSSPPQMTLVPPTTPATQMTMAQTAKGSALPVTMSVAIATDLLQPATPTPQTPAIEPPAPTQASAPAIPAMTRPTDEQAPIAPSASTPTALPHATTPAQPQIEAAAPSTSTTTTAPVTANECVQSPPDLPGTPAIVVAPPTASPVPLPHPTATSSAIATSKQPALDPVDALRKVCLRFHAVARQLRLRKDYRTTLEVEDNYDLHDLLCALLKLEFDEVGADEWTPSYADGSTRTTLLLNQDRLAVVSQKTRSGLTTKELAEQIAADTAHYASRKPCVHLFYFIYDPEGRIGSPTRLETDLTSVSDSFTVDVLVAPK
ncbi:MAG: hypothetical protein LZF86_220022 [Nitrospira sp.]|nr:MAG: hypothetical protein LZF86_220022 [Nitrospira sp.]